MNLNSENSEEGYQVGGGEEGVGGLFVEDESGGVYLVDENWVDKIVADDEGEKSIGVVNDENVEDGRSANTDMPNFEDEDDGGVFFVEDDGDDSNAGEGSRAEFVGELKLIDSEADILNLGDLNLLSPHDIHNWEFADVDVAFKFYFEYAKSNGFSIRRGRTLRNKKTLEEYQKEFWCSRAGTREDRGLRMEDRVREPRPITRCNCFARFVVHVNKLSGRWFCVCFVDEHNHDLLGPVHCSMLPAYRRMADSDVVQMNNMIKVGIRPPNIFSTFASQSGGYEKIGFRKKDLYNKINEQRRKLCFDAQGAIQFLGELRLIDNMMYFEHTVDEGGRLQHLFWSDGKSQVDYKLFGEVLAFDATYGKNKYFMPLVVFSGVNNHNRSTIFVAAIIANETEETYVWLLEQFSRAMKGNLPNCVITDGDVAMRNAIELVFPNAHHRLCAWHLMRNATSNVKNADFTKAFEDCMLHYYDVGTFRRKWNEIISKFGLEDNQWVGALFEKRSMWATAYLRGKFFGGFRTTSRCEGLHSELAKFVHSRYNLSDFLQHFHRCLSHMRFKEKEDDYTSIHGDPVMQTQMQSLETFAAKVYTRRVFFLFRRVMHRASMLVINGYTQAVRCTIFKVRGQSDNSVECSVSLYPSNKELKCGCLKMESRGLPCEHIVAVLGFLGIDELPESLVLKRWSKGAKDGIFKGVGENNEPWDAGWSARRAALNALYDDVSAFKAATIEKFNVERERLLADLRECRVEQPPEHETRRGSSSNVAKDTVRNPVRASTKGSGVASSSSGLRVRRKQICSICKLPGHNKLTCPSRGQQFHASEDGGAGTSSQHVDDGDDLGRYEEFDPESWTFE